jgi:hypothetical protein
MWCRLGFGNHFVLTTCFVSHEKWANLAGERKQPFKDPSTWRSQLLSIYICMRKLPKRSNGQDVPRSWRPSSHHHRVCLNLTPIPWSWQSGGVIVATTVSLIVPRASRPSCPLWPCPLSVLVHIVPYSQPVPINHSQKQNPSTLNNKCIWCHPFIYSSFSQYLS